ncbi:hypothetical protein G5714_023796 [Onychostoma macrolepis]|uniref:Uncharacterized protein n=1 Tax=Onychostoma macrolepis TaxID=369639 RepID=A0A7J6BI67_9TELE|nr:hypothetical protein G5714_023796 [Onychostoma macrolepis]
MTSVVPVSWIFDDNGTLKCRWTSSLSNIKNNSPPNPNWKVYDIVKIVGPSIGDYDQANQYISDYTTGVSAAEDSITYSMRDPAVVELPEKRKGKRSSVMKVTSIQRHLPVKQSGNEVKQSGLKTRNVPLPKPPIYHDALQRSAKKDEDDPKSSAFSEFHDLQQHHMTSKEIPEVQTRIPDDVHLKKSRNAMKRVGLKTKNVQLAKSPIYHVKSPLIQKVPRVKTSGDCLDDNTEIPDKSYFNSSQPNPVFLDTLQGNVAMHEDDHPKSSASSGRNQRKQNAKSPWRNCLVHYLIHTHGSSNIGEMVRQSLKSIATDDVLCLYNRTGKDGKKVLPPVLLTCLKRCVRSFQTHNEIEVKKQKVVTITTPEAECIRQVEIFVSNANTRLKRKENKEKN